MTSTAFCLACSSVKKVVEEVKGLFLYFIIMISLLMFVSS